MVVIFIYIHWYLGIHPTSNPDRGAPKGVGSHLLAPVPFSKAGGVTGAARWRKLSAGGSEKCVAAVWRQVFATIAKSVSDDWKKITGHSLPQCRSFRRIDTLNPHPWSFCLRHGTGFSMGLYFVEQGHGTQQELFRVCFEGFHLNDTARTSGQKPASLRRMAKRERSMTLFERFWALRAVASFSWHKTEALAEDLLTCLLALVAYSPEV